jgi:hypothetical protein
MTQTERQLRKQAATIIAALEIETNPDNIIELAKEKRAIVKRIIRNAQSRENSKAIRDDYESAGMVKTIAASVKKGRKEDEKDKQIFVRGQRGRPGDHRRSGRLGRVRGCRI